MEHAGAYYLSAVYLRIYLSPVYLYEKLSGGQPKIFQNSADLSEPASDPVSFGDTDAADYIYPWKDNRLFSGAESLCALWECYCLSDPDPVLLSSVLGDYECGEENGDHTCRSYFCDDFVDPDDLSRDFAGGGRSNDDFARIDIEQ